MSRLLTNSIVAVAVLLAAQHWIAPSPCLAQQKGHRLVELLRRLDRDGDGQVAPGEVPAAIQPIVARIAQRLKLDPTRPIAIEAVERSLADNGSGQSSSTEKNKSDFKGPSSNKGGASTPRLVPGFGVPDKRKPVAGFDVPYERGAPRSSGLGAGRGGSRPSRSANSASNSEAANRNREYAKSYLRQFDANKNGVLDRKEWGKMKGDPEKDDLNKDGHLTVDEIVVRLENYSKGKSSNSSSKAHSRSTKSGSGNSYIGRRPAERDTNYYRALSPIERLPRGLPDWFARNDANADGQIGMSEYATTWNDAKAAEFASYDLNRDGVITPAECLEAKESADTK